MQPPTDCRNSTESIAGSCLHTFTAMSRCGFMCSWDTQFEDVDALAADIRATASVQPRLSKHVRF